MALPMFALTLFVSAFLLFLIQPMIGKMILPRLGGTPQVWNTCMVFFQAALLAGYAYTHTVSTRLGLRRQVAIHSLLLFVPVVVLLVLQAQPFPIANFLPPPGANPIPYTLYYLTLVVGLPFFVVATSAPLLQKWFAATGHPAGKDPYFLYGASNLGSMLALLAYPFVIEPNLLLRNQAWTWTAGYGLLLVLVLLCALLVWQTVKGARLGAAAVDEGSAVGGGMGKETSSTDIASGPPSSQAGPALESAKSTAIKKPGKFPHKTTGKDIDLGSISRGADELTSWRKLRWVGLAAVPSSLMLGVTTHVTTDLSPIPLIWLVFLAIYLLSFILVFTRWPVVWTETPHTIMLYLQPAALGLMIFWDLLATKEHNIYALVSFLVLGFFWTAMVCHGELARDRPSTKHLTEYYLLMSVGGVVGGSFNALLAPILFPSVWEFPIAVMAACLLRPTLKVGGWLDNWLGGLMETSPGGSGPPKKGSKHQPRPIAKVEKNPSFHYTMDLVLAGGILIVLLGLLTLKFPSAVEISHMERADRGRWYFYMFGLPLVVSCFFFGRPLRYGLTVASVLLVSLIHAGEGRGVVFSGRTYFGVVRVLQTAQNMPDAQGDLKVHPYYQMMHGTTDHGMNFEKPKDQKFWGHPQEDYSRLATTYYHQLGPAGRAMEKFNWFQDQVNHYHSDGRMPAYLVGLGAAASAGGINLPLDQLVGLWSEPAYATIGLGTGTMASYGRPYQAVHFYEIDNLVKGLSLPEGRGKAYFTYLRGALNRGAVVQVLMGDARLRMAQPYQNFHQAPKTSGGPDSFYHLMVVDAFSSDAIPVHLITQEAIQMYFKKLTPEGVLCVHTSNRHVDLVKVVADVAESLHLFCKRGHDQAPLGRRMGQYTSEWVMVARDPKHLEHLKAPKDYSEKLRKARSEGSEQVRVDEQYWETPTPSARGKYVWTDDYSNLIAVLK